MAYWNRKKNGHVFVYFSDNGKQHVLPRAETAHLDNQPDHNIEFWVSEWERRQGIVRAESAAIGLQAEKWVDDYCTYMLSLKRSPKTISDHRKHLSRDIIPFFQSQGAADPNQWPAYSPKIAGHLRDRGVPETSLQKINTALRAFFEWLTDERIVLSGHDLRVRPAHREQEQTPLQHLLRPEEVLEFVQYTTEMDMKLLALFGYFFSLRPQETFAVTPIDLRAGTVAAGLECGHTMTRYKMFDRLAVHITKQLTQAGKETKPKAHSVGWVSCFDEQAARTLVGLLEGLDPESKLFKFRPDWLYKRWRKHGISGVTLKDLRRASLYYLGHHCGLDLLSLQKHARHKKTDTTLLYLRRPEERLTEGWSLKLDA